MRFDKLSYFWAVFWPKTAIAKVSVPVRFDKLSYAIAAIVVGVADWFQFL